MLKTFGPLEEASKTPCYYIDIGCGYAEVFFDIASKNPDKFCIAVEKCPWLFPILVREAKKRKLDNALIIGGAIEGFWNYLPKHSIREAAVLFPDPWWKRKHYKFRFFSHDFVWHLQDKVKMGGIVNVTSDVWFWQLYMMRQVESEKYFENIKGFFEFTPWEYEVNTKRGNKVLNDGLPFWTARYKRNDEIFDKDYKPFYYLEDTKQRD